MEYRQRKLFYGWFILLSGFASLFVAFGARMSFGLFFKSMQQDFDLSRASLSLVVSLTMLIYGLAQPLVGGLLDRYGPRVVFAFFGTLLGAGLVGTGMVTKAWQLYLVYGLALGLGFGGVTFVTVVAMVSRWFVRKRGMAIGIATAGSSVGQFALVPLATYLLLQYGWRYAQVLMGLLVLATVIPLAIWVMKKDPSQVSCGPDGDPLFDRWSNQEEGAKVPATRPGAAFGTQTFWKLAGGFFVCGFTSIMVSTHLVPHATDVGHSEVTAAFALALMGGLNFAGVLAIGSASDLVGRRIPLSLVYLTRGLSFLLIILTDQVWALYLFAMVFGLSWMATVPLTSGLVGDTFGPAYLGTIFGAISLSHQVGAALGSFLGGLSYDLTGSYNSAFFLSLGLGAVASLLSYLVDERRRVPATARIYSVEIMPTLSGEK